MGRPGGSRRYSVTRGPKKNESIQCENQQDHEAKPCISGPFASDRKLIFDLLYQIFAVFHADSGVIR